MAIFGAAVGQRPCACPLCPVSCISHEGPAPVLGVTLLPREAQITSLDLTVALSSQLGIADQPAARAATARLLLTLAHDANGLLGSAILRWSSLRRGLGQLQTLGAGPGGAGRGETLARLGDSQCALDEALVGLRTLFAGVADAATRLEAPDKAHDTHGSQERTPGPSRPSRSEPVATSAEPPKPDPDDA